jgi:hypothetical protein
MIEHEEAEREEVKGFEEEQTKMEKINSQSSAESLDKEEELREGGSSDEDWEKQPEIPAA